MKNLKKEKIANPHARSIVLTLRVNAAEMRELFKRATTLTKGKVGEYVRYSALHFKPIKEDFQK